jgi:serine/threonine protein kinase
LSPNRVFISAKNNSVILLASVQMSGMMSFANERGGDEYSAPEAGNGRRTMQSDIYALGAFAYDFLTLNGELIPTDMPELLEMLKLSRAYNADKRPKIIELYRCFLQQLDILLSCKTCKNDFVYTAKSCPDCDTPLPKMFKARLYDKAAELQIDRGTKVIEFAATRQCFWNYHTDNVLLRDSVEPRIDCALNISADKKLRFIFKNLMEKEIEINGNPVAPGAASIVALPVEQIQIAFKLHTSTTRHIDMVMA